MSAPQKAPSLPPQGSRPDAPPAPPKKVGQPASLVTFPMKWVKLAKYCELSGDTKNAVYQKRSKRKWVDGVHCKIAGDGCLWVNLEEVGKWLDQQKSGQPEASPSDA